MNKKKPAKAVAKNTGTTKKVVLSMQKSGGLEKKTKSPIRKNSLSAIKKQSGKRKGSRTITEGRRSHEQKTGLKSYNEGFNVGFAKGFEDGHTLAYQGEAN